jgi:hypothetical protein
MRWTTGIGIAVGGAGGAIAALMGAPQAPAPPPPQATGYRLQASGSTDAGSSRPKPEAGSPPRATGYGLQASGLADAGSSRPKPEARSLKPATVITPPPLELPTTREALLKAELYCDQRKDFDECSRAAQALDSGTAGPADPTQAKRFRRIALTHVVMQCESGSPHACFVLAAKYRAGYELAANATSAEALEKRGADLCRLGRTAPECPTP